LRFIEQDARDAAKRLERRDVATQEVLHPGIQEVAKENLSGMAQHHHEGHQRAVGTADLQVAKMPPVHLCLLTGQAAQPQIRLRGTPRPVQGNEVAEVIGAAPVAAFVHHREQAARRQRRELRQRLADQRQVGIDLRWPRGSADAGQSGLRQHPLHHAVVHVQLTGDGADRPFLGMVVAQDLRLDVRRRHHGVRVPSGRVQHGRDDAGGDAGPPGEAAARSGGRTSGSAGPMAGTDQQEKRCRSWSASRPTPADHPPAAGVNHDASLFLAAPGSGPVVQRASGRRERSSGNAGQPR
jgi:hypothetical protein